MQIQIKKFSDLTAEQWWEIARERVQAFIVERARPFQEFDEDDLSAYHILLNDSADHLIGYSRLLVENDHVIMSHLFIKKEERDQGKGQYLVNYTVQTAQHLFPGKTIQMEVYNYLQSFFSELGFTNQVVAENNDNRFRLMEYR